MRSREFSCLIGASEEKRGKWPDAKPEDLVALNFQKITKDIIRKESIESTIFTKPKMDK